MLEVPETSSRKRSAVSGTGTTNMTEHSISTALREGSIGRVDYWLPFVDLCISISLCENFGSLPRL